MIPDSRLSLQIINYMVCANFDYTVSCFLASISPYIYVYMHMFTHTLQLGKTALHFAVDQEHEDIVELLLEANADPDLAEVITLTITVQSTENDTL